MRFNKSEVKVAALALSNACSQSQSAGVFPEVSISSHAYGPLLSSQIEVRTICKSQITGLRHKLQETRINGFQRTDVPKHGNCDSLSRLARYLGL